MSQLTCTDLTLGYDNNIVLKDLNFKVDKGDYLCVIGDNGAGKTTLMKAVLGLLKPLHGDISWGDGLNKNEIGYLTQQSEIQKEFPASVREVVISGFQSKSWLKPFYTKAQKQQALGIMKKLGVDGFAKRCYRELSGGQQQRVLLSRALCSTQKILFLDEPTSGLDPKVSLEMYEIVAGLNKNDDVTIIMISHDIENSIRYASHVLRIGTDIFYGTQQEYLKMLSESSSNTGGIR